MHARLVALFVIAAAVLTFPSAEAATEEVPPTIDPTGSSDVTEELLEFFESVPDGSTIQFQPDGRYRIDGSLLIVDRNDLVFDGRGATFVAESEGDRDRRHWWIHGGSNIVLKDMTVLGAHPEAGLGDDAWREDKEFQHGFHLAGIDGVELDSVKVTDVFGDFVYLGKATEGEDANRRVTDVHIHDSHFERNGRQGIAITAAEDVLIEDNYIGMTRRATFDLEPPTETWDVDRVHIRNNRIGDGRLLFVASAGQGPVDDILVENNELDQRPMTVVVDPPEGLRRSGWRFFDNRTNSQHGSPQNATMRFVRVDGIEVRGNVQPLQERRDMYLVKTIESCDIVVEDNELGPHALGQVTIEPYDGCDGGDGGDGGDDDDGIIVPDPGPAAPAPPPNDVPDAPEAPAAPDVRPDRVDPPPVTVVADGSLRPTVDLLEPRIHDGTPVDAAVAGPTGDHAEPLPDASAPTSGPAMRGGAGPQPASVADDRIVPEDEAPGASEGATAEQPRGEPPALDDADAPPTADPGRDEEPAPAGGNDGGGEEDGEEIAAVGTSSDRTDRLPAALGSVVAIVVVGLAAGRRLLLGGDHRA